MGERYAMMTEQERRELELAIELSKLDQIRPTHHESSKCRCESTCCCSNLCSRKRLFCCVIPIIIFICVCIGVGVYFLVIVIFNSSENSTKTLITTSTTNTTTSTTSVINTTMTTSSTTDPPTTTTTTTTTTRTRTTPVPEPCPPILPQLIQRDNLLLLNATATSSNYTQYNFSFDTPDAATTALLVFEFQTRAGSWYLDDVSIRRNDGSGAELIRNGGFENGISNIIWSYCYPPLSTSTPVISATSCHSGRYCFASRYLLSNKDYLSQNFTIESNTRYNIEFYTFCNNGPSIFNATISFQ